MVRLTPVLPLVSASALAISVYDVGGEPRAVADHPHAHAVAVQFGDLAAQVVAQEAHQIVDLFERPLPILRRKPEQGQIGNAELAGRGHRTPHGLCAASVPGNARQTAGLRPTAVPVHDDRDMPRSRARRGTVRAHQT